jgi:TolA-binding protein
MMLRRVRTLTAALGLLALTAIGGPLAAPGTAHAADVVESIGGDSNLVLVHTNDMPETHALVELVYRIDGQVVFRGRGDEVKTGKDIRIYAGAVSSGPRKVTVEATYEDTAKRNLFSEVFSYADRQRIVARWTSVVRTLPGRFAVVAIRAVGKEGTEVWTEKPAFTVDAKTCDNATCGGVVQAKEVKRRVMDTNRLAPTPKSLGGESNLALIQENRLGPEFRLAELSFFVEDELIYYKRRGEIPDAIEFPIYVGSAPSEDRLLRVEAVVEDPRAKRGITGFFTSKTVRLKWSNKVRFPLNRWAVIRMLAVENEDAESWNERPILLADVRVCADPQCTTGVDMAQDTKAQLGMSPPKAPETIGIPVPPVGSADAEMHLVHDNQMSADYEPIELLYRIDGTPVFTSRESIIRERAPLPIHKARIVSGSHRIDMEITYRETGGFFGNLFKFGRRQAKVRWGTPVNVPQGKLALVTFIGYEQGGTTDAWQDKPAFRAEVRICNDERCEESSLQDIRPGVAGTPRIGAPIALPEDLGDGAFLSITHDSMLSDEYQPMRMQYSVGERDVYNRRADAMGPGPAYSIYESSVAPGPRQIAVEIDYLMSKAAQERTSSNQQKKMRLTWLAPVNVPKGKYGFIKFYAFPQDQSGPDWKDKPAIRAELQVCSDAACTDGFPELLIPTESQGFLIDNNGNPIAGGASVNAAGVAGNLGGDGNLTISYKNSMGSLYRLNGLYARFDNQTVFANQDDDLAKRPGEIEMYNGAAPSGTHIVQVQSVFAGNSSVLAYLSSYRVRNQWRAKVEVPAGKYVFLYFENIEKTALLSDWSEKPGVKGRIRVCDDPQCTGVTGDDLFPEQEAPADIGEYQGDLIGDLGGDSHLVLTHHDELSSNYALTQLSYTVDSLLVANKRPSEMDDRSHISAYAGRIPEGSHAIRMSAVAEPTEADKRKQGVKVRVEWSAPVRIPPGKYAVVDFYTFEREDDDLDWAQRPTVRAEVRICDDARCEGVIPITLQPGSRDVQEDIRSFTLDEIRAMLDEAELKLTVVRNEVPKLQKDVSIDEEMTDLERVRLRALDGQYFYDQGQYDRAAIALLDAADTPALKTEPETPGYSLLLADSLRNQGELEGAKRYYLQVAQAPNADSRAKGEALGRLVVIADTQRDRAALERHMSALKQLPADSAPATLNYLLGRALYHVGDTRAALDTLERIPNTDPDYPRARYFIGASLFKAGKKDQALETFANLAAGEYPDPNQQRYVDLANMAVARITYDAGDFEKAREIYARLDAASDLFGESLYETAWAHLRQNQLDEANNALELYTLFENGEFELARARMLQGEIYVRRDEFDRAAIEMNAVSEMLAPTYDRLGRAAQDSKHRDQYFKQIASIEDERFAEAEPLPALGMSLARKEPGMKAALDLTSDLEKMRDTIDRSQTLIRKLTRMLSGEDGIEVFKRLSDGNVQAATLETALTDVEAQLGNVLTLLVAPSLTDDELEPVRDTRAERVVLQQRHRETPATLAGMAARQQEELKELAPASMSLLAARVELGYNKKRLAGVKVYWADRADRGEATPEMEAELKKRVADERKLIKKQETELEELQDLLEQERERYSFSASIRRDEDLRTVLLDVSTRERFSALRYRSRLKGERRLLAERAEQLLVEVRALREGLAGLRMQLKQYVAQRGGKLKTDLAGENKTLDGHKVAISQFEKENELVSGDVAMGALQKVQTRLYDVVLQSDLGLLDVAWQRKQTRSDNINKLTRSMNAETQELDREFTEVRKGAE